MVEKNFYLQSQTELQRIGLRAQIVSYLILEGVKKGNVLNDSENKKKVIVAINITYDPQNQKTELEKIESIRTNLVSYLNGLSTADEECYTHFPSDISATDLADLNNPHTVDIINLSDISSAFMLEQTSKGVGAMLGLKKVLVNLVTKLEPLAELPEILKKLKQS